jgi:flavodoxin
VDRKRILLVFYSRSGMTRKISSEFKKHLDCDVEEIFDMKRREGILGWLGAGRDAGSKNLTDLKEVEFDPASYDVVVIGTPTWNNTMSTPIRTYIIMFRDVFKKVALFSTQDGEESDTLRDMEALIGKKPVATMALVRKKEVETGDFLYKLDKFTGNIKKNIGEKP